ncbi:hypothetical protein L218DRAFT_5817 [Marasmius fiardii PR-910]|nr:hypothetical protein L218DRAFT_5817 [Marasmius fiardii PR-910]
MRSLSSSIHGRTGGVLFELIVLGVCGECVIPHLVRGVSRIVVHPCGPPWLHCRVSELPFTSEGLERTCVDCNKRRPIEPQQKFHTLRHNGPICLVCQVRSRCTSAPNLQTIK